MAKYRVSPHGAIFIPLKGHKGEGPGSKKCHPGEVVELDSKFAKHFVKVGRLDPYIPDDDDDADGVDAEPVAQDDPVDVGRPADPVGPEQEAATDGPEDDLIEPAGEPVASRPQRRRRKAN